MRGMVAEGTALSDAETLRVCLLGPPRVELSGSPIEVDTRKATALLAYLAVTEREHRRESLAALLWPDYDTAHSRAALRRTLSALNRALDGRWLQASRAVVGLDHEHLWLDVEEFRARASGCSSHRPRAVSECDDCLAACTDAVSLHRGGFLAGFSLRDSPAFDDWQFLEAEALARDLGALLDRLVGLNRSRGELELAAEHARRRLSLDPLHEPAHVQLMELYALTGQRVAAVRQYRECVAVLDRELGVAPLEATTKLYGLIREGELRPQTTTLVGEEAGPPSDAPTTPRRELPLVGRRSEWAALLETYGSVGPDGRLVVLQGEAGIGKTRLAHELLAYGRGRGAPTAAARGREDEGHIPYGVMVELLRSAVRNIPSGETSPLDDLPARHLTEARRLLPEIADRWPHLPPAPTVDGPGAQSRFFDGVVETVTAAVAGGAPGLLLLDDLQWIDDSSLELLTYLVRRLAGRPIVVVATWRTEEVPGDHRLRSLLGEVKREGFATVVELPRLGPAHIAELMQAADLEGATPDLSDRLHEETEGVPFFVIEYLAAAGADPGGEAAIPEGVRDLLASRIAPLSETARQLLGAAAVTGRSFDFEMVRNVSGRSEQEAVDGLDELLGRGLIVPATGDQGGDGSPAYDFGHARIRSFVLDGISAPRRRLLHARVGDALAHGRLFPARPEHALIAGHYQLGGREDEAARHFKLAGDHAASLYANSDALVHFEAALSLGHPDVAALHEAIGDLQTLSGDYGAALRSYEAAAASGPDDLAAVEQKLGRLQDRLGGWTAAASHFKAVIEGLPEDGGRRARVLADWSLTSHHAGDDGRAAGDEFALAQARNILGVLATKGGNPEVAVGHLEASLGIARRLQDPVATVAALNNLALAHRARGELKPSAELTAEALALCTAQGDHHREAALHNNLADILHDAGRSDEAMGHLKRAVALFAEIGEPGTMQPAIWKLVEW